MLLVSEKKSERMIVRVEIDAAAKEVVDAYADREDMTKTGVLSRVYEFFGQQPDYVQDYMLGKTREELRADTLKKIIEHFERLLTEEEIEIVGEPGKVSPLNRQTAANGKTASGPKPRN